MQWFFEKGVKKGVKSPNKEWNRWYRGIFRWKPMQTLYILVALNQAVFMVKIENFEVWIKGVKTFQKGVKLLI